MAFVNVSSDQRRFGQTARRDLWWVQPALIFLGLHAGVEYIEYGLTRDAKALRRRTARLVLELRSLGYQVTPPAATTQV
jgi:hypothetical protein